MAKISKTLSAKQDKHTGKVEVLFRFVGSSTIVLRAKSRIYVDPKCWNAKTGSIKTATFGQEEANTKKRIDDLCNVIVEAFTQSDRTQVDKQWLETIIDKFHHPEKYAEQPAQQQTLIEDFAEYLEKHKLSDMRKRGYKVIGRALRRFELYSKQPLTLDGLTPDTLRAFEQFLRDEHKLFEQHPEIYEAVPETRTPQPRGQNTINEIFTRLRTFVLWCIKTAKKSQNNPFDGYKIEESTYGRPIYISNEERNKIYTTDLSSRPSLAVQRDIFVFQCLIGCRVGDLYKLTPDNVINGTIHYIPRKTKEGRPVTVGVPLNETAKDILTRYENKGLTRLLPFISEQKYNKAIKEAFVAAGITRNVVVINPTTGEQEVKPINEIASSHLARRAFVGNLYKAVKDPNLVGALSGHKEGSRAFARYRDIDENMKQELIKLLE